MFIILDRPRSISPLLWMSLVIGSVLLVHGAFDWLLPSTPWLQTNFSGLGMSLLFYALATPLDRLPGTHWAALVFRVLGLLVLVLNLALIAWESNVLPLTAALVVTGLCTVLDRTFARRSL